MNDELPLVKDCYAIALEAQRRVEKFPRSFRYGLGAELNRLANLILQDALRAKFAAPSEKRELLRALNLDIELLRFQVRLAADLKAMPHGGQEHLIRLLDGAGRQAGGWLRSLAVREGQPS